MLNGAFFIFFTSLNDSMTEEQSQEDKHLQNGEPITLVGNQKNTLNIAKAD